MAAVPYYSPPGAHLPGNQPGLLVGITPSDNVSSTDTLVMTAAPSAFDV